MRTRPFSRALFGTVLVGIAVACSSEQGSTVDPKSHGAAGMRSGSGGSAATAGSAGRASMAAGAPSSPVTGGSSLPSQACNGLPIDLSGDAQAGSGSVNAGGASDGGAPFDSASAGAAADEACNGVSVEAEAVPVDVFVIMDRSQSMGLAIKGSNTTRWQALRDAVQNFTEAPRAAEIRAGIGFFSLSAAGDDTQDCNPDAYAKPIVPIAPISEVGPDLVEAMDRAAPGGLTPTVPALRGAISYARSWALDNPGRATVVVLVTDGYPTQCDSAPEQISQAARAGFESPEHIRTFVIGVGDVAKFNLDNYARSGGTKSAYLTDAGDVSTTFVDALNNITNRALACEYQLPPPPEGMKLDANKVQFIYTPSSDLPEEIPRISSLAACANTPNGGWYYDDPNQPSKIAVCPCTCARLQAGRVDVRLGCKPRLGLR
jgi:von Willebrand factor type A domain-containing protein